MPDHARLPFRSTLKSSSVPTMPSARRCWQLLLLVTHTRALAVGPRADGFARCRWPTRPLLLARAWHDREGGPLSQAVAIGTEHLERSAAVLSAKITEVGRTAACSGRCLPSDLLNAATLSLLIAEVGQLALVGSLAWLLLPLGAGNSFCEAARVAAQSRAYLRLPRLVLELWLLPRALHRLYTRPLWQRGRLVRRAALALSSGVAAAVALAAAASTCLRPPDFWGAPIAALGAAAYGRLLLPALSLVMDAGGWAAALPSAEDARGALGVASEAMLAAAATATLALDDLSVAARTLKPVRAALELAECDDWLLATARQEAAALVGVRRWWARA